MKCNCGGLIKAIDAYIAKADGDLSDALEAAGFLDPDGTMAEIVSIEERVAAVLTLETDYILEALKDTIDLEAFVRDVWPKLKASDTSAQDLFEIFREEFEGYMTPLASEYIAQTDAELVVETVSKHTTNWIKVWSQELASLMQLDGHTMIENILSQAMEEGQSVAEVTQSILDSGIRNEYFRARRVAVTETLRAHSVASQEAMMQSPAVQEKEWRHTGSYRNAPRQNHVDMNGKHVPKGDTFTLDGADGKTYYPSYPRDTILPPGESVNCHCIAQAIADEDVLGLPVEERRRLQDLAVAEMDDEWEKKLDDKNKEASGL